MAFVLTGFLAWGVAAALVVVAGIALYVRRRRRVARALGDPAIVSRMAGEDLASPPWPRVIAVCIAAVAVAAALADPRWGVAESDPVRGGTVVLVLDASSSMLAADLAPSRLERERDAARTLARELPGSPIGIVAFAGRAYAVAPPTLDPGAVDLYLDALHPDMVTQSGSSLAAAVRQGLAMLLASERAGEGAIVLVSDGDTEEDPEMLRAAADLARRAGVRVHVLGAGTAEGAPVPSVDFETGTTRGFMRTADGEPVVSRLREAPLRELADRTGGAYLELADPEAARRLAPVLRSRATAAQGLEDPGALAAPRYQWFAILALALLAWESAAGGRRRET